MIKYKKNLNIKARKYYFLKYKEFFSGHSPPPSHSHSTKDIFFKHFSFLIFNHSFHISISNIFQTFFASFWLFENILLSWLTVNLHFNYECFFRKIFSQQGSFEGWYLNLTKTNADNIIKLHKKVWRNLGCTYSE